VALCAARLRGSQHIDEPRRWIGPERNSWRYVSCGPNRLGRILIRWWEAAQSAVALALITLWPIM
jgi:hypothetical protein